jgi:DNA-binding PadR family transcriptional regulator
MPFRRVDSLLPLTPIAFEILMALVDEDRHGYAVLQHVEQRVGSALPLRTGTLYRALARLMDDGLIEQVTPEQLTAKVGSDKDTTDPRRRYYRITALGRDTAAAEARRLEDQVAAARRHKLLSGTRK